MIDNIFKYDTVICNCCGEDIPKGIMYTINHQDICKRNAPNECIESYRLISKIEINRLKEQKEWKPIFAKMSPEEHKCLFLLQSNGSWQNDGKGGYTVLMGLGQFKMVNEFKDKMIDKYEKRNIF